MHCMFPACVNGCRGHAAASLKTHPVPMLTNVYSGPSHHGALLQHIVDRAHATPHHTRILNNTNNNPYKGMRKALRTNFRFKGMASRSFS